MTVHLVSRVGRRAGIAAALLVVTALAPVSADSVSARYQRIAEREAATRALPSASVAALRTLARAYEAFTRAHPVNGFADNALWQAAGLYDTVFSRTKDPHDREQAVRLFTWLKREYPSGRLAKETDVRLKALTPAESAARTSVERPGSAVTATPGPPPRSPAPKPDAAVADAPPAPGRASIAPPAPQPKPAATKESAPIAAAVPPVVHKDAVDSTATGPVSAPTGPARPATRTLSPATTVAATTAGASKGRSVDSVVSAAPLAPMAPAAPASFPVAVKAVSYTSLPKGDRLIVELTGEATYSSSRAPNSDRVFVDLQNAGAAPAIAERASHIGGTLLKSLTVATSSTGAARLVLQLDSQARYSTFPLYDPFRLVIDVESESAAMGAPTSPLAGAVVAKTSIRSATPVAKSPRAGTEAMPAAFDGPSPVAPPATVDGQFSLARQLGLGVHRVVIDPGHGGHDPGASGNGITEASLVLDVALRLETILTSQSAIDVVLTRRTDEYVPLEERTAIANRDAADMFISIHANASPEKTARGVETFFLDFASTPHAQAVAARENASSAQTMRVLPELVKTIALTNKLQESHELAGIIQTSVSKRLHLADAGSKDLGVKRAPFVVLIGAQMPSVLVEISFLTNHADAALLKQPAYHQRIAQSLADAILKYQGTLKKVSNVTARNGL